MALLVLTGLLAAGCMRSDVDLVLKEDGTVDGTIVVAVREELVTIGGQDVDRFVAGLITRDGGPPDGSLGLPLAQFVGERYDQDGYVGALYRLDSVDAEDFDQPASNRPLFNQREDGSWRFEAALVDDEPFEDFSGLSGLDLEASVTVQVVFPLAVRTHNGTLVQGRNNVVRWEIDLTEEAPVLSATTSTKPAASVDDSGFPWRAVLIGGGAVVMVAGLGLLWWRIRARKRRGRGPVTGGPPAGGPPGGGPVEEGAPVTPGAGPADAGTPPSPPGSAGPS
jgi:hypothetical protein